MLIKGNNNSLDEEKLTVDNCLCDACFRHVDRRANVPAYAKRMEACSTSSSGAGIRSSSKNNLADTTSDTVMEEENSNSTSGIGDNDSSTDHRCIVSGCLHPAKRSVKRKCIRKSVKKFLLHFKIPDGEQGIWLCQNHYDSVIQCNGCVMCKRRLSKNHMYHIPTVRKRVRERQMNYTY